MYVLTINDRVGSLSGFPGVRAFIGCDKQATDVAQRIRALGWSCDTEEVPLEQLPERNEAEKETVARLMEMIHGE